MCMLSLSARNENTENGKQTMKRRRKQKKNAYDRSVLIFLYFLLVIELPSTPDHKRPNQQMIKLKLNSIIQNK